MANELPPDYPSFEDGRGALLKIRPDIADPPELSKSLGSAERILSDDLGGVLEGKKLEWNEMSQEEELGRKAIEDVDVIRIRVAVERTFTVQGKGKSVVPLKLSKDDTFDALKAVARKSTYHPVREDLRREKWDGIALLERLPTYLSAEDSPINRALTRRWSISAVARVMDPGCKVDTVLVLVGAQGTQKSTFFEDMATRPWFCDSKLEIGTDDAYERLKGVWIYEMSELDALRRKEWTATKAFLSQRHDKLHRRYDRLHHVHKRDCVLVGTTNTHNFLDDETGARRFWPVAVGQIDRAAVLENRRRLWNEAVAAYDAGEQWWLTREEEQMLVDAQDPFTVTDELTDDVMKFATDTSLSKFQIADVLKLGLKMLPSQIDMSMTKRVAAILSKAGYVDKKIRGLKYWRKP